MDRLTALVGELEAMQARLRSTAVVLRGEPVSIQLADGTTIQGSTGDVTSAINPDGPAAADAIDKAIATLKAQQEALEPFARIATGAPEDATDEDWAAIRFVHLRAARASIEGSPTA